ncbi:MAG: ParB N-terminal domain-containing protein, partial [Planctomycetota bacterium]
MTRDRVKELRRVRAGDLTPHPHNWRTHSRHQRDVLRGVLAEVGYADALLARELTDGSLQLVDGHLRAEATPNAIVPVLVVDLDDAEAEKVLLTHDPLASMAGSDSEQLRGLMQRIDTDHRA